MSTGVSCTVLVDGIRAADGSPGDNLNDPVILENLSVAWGRSDTMTQPAVDACTFDVMDAVGNGTGLRAFMGQFRTGSRIDVLARGLTFGTPSAPTFVNPGFETAAVTWTGTNANATVTTQRFASGTKALHVRATDPTNAAVLILAPAPFEPAGTNPDAWDAIPTTEVGQAWQSTLSLWLPLGSVAQVRPVLFTGPYANAGTATGTATVVAGNDAWQTVTREYVVPMSGSYWVGLEVRFFPVGRAWDEMPAALQWNGVNPAFTWDDMGSMFVDDVQVTSSSEESSRSVLVFSGRVTELTAGWDDSAKAPVVSVVANGFTADLQNRSIGDEPWLVESVDTRAHKILTLAGLPITIDIDSSLKPTLLTWRDVDSQGALGLLQSIASSVDGVLWPAVHSSLGAYLRLEDPEQRESLLKLDEELGPAPVLVATNRATNPSFETTSGTVAVRTNLAFDPRGTSSTYWKAFLGGTGQTLTVAPNTPIAAPFPGGPTTAFKATATTSGGTYIDVRCSDATTGRIPVTPGATYGLSMWAQFAQAASVYYYVQWADSAGAVLSTVTTAVPGTVAAGTWQRYAKESLVAPAGAAWVWMIVRRQNAIVAGDVAQGTALLVETGSGLIGTYFDGATPSADPDLTAVWSGTANASTSILRGVGVTGVIGQPGYAAVFSSTLWKERGARSVRISAQRTNGDTFAEVLNMIGAPPSVYAGRTITVLATVRLTAPSVAPLSVNARRFRISVKNAANVTTEITGNITWLATAPNAAGTYEVRGTVFIPTDATAWGLFRIYHGGSQGSEDIWWDSLALIEGDYRGPYFDGTTPDTTTMDYAWTGAAHASTSTQTTIQQRTIIIEETDPSGAFHISACDILRDPVSWVQSVADLTTRVDVSWKLQGVDGDGNPTATDTKESVVDAALELRHGTRAVSVSTELQSATDAQLIAEKILARTSSEAWRASGITLDDEDLEAGQDSVSLLLDLLDGTSRIGAPVVLEELPTWAPGGEIAGVYLEGGTYRFIGGRWVLDLGVSSGELGLGGSAAWDELNPLWKWNDWHPDITWNDLHGVAAD